MFRADVDVFAKLDCLPAFAEFRGIPGTEFRGHNTNYLMSASFLRIDRVAYHRMRELENT